LRIDSGPGRAMPPANIQANAQVKGGSARIDARLTAGNRAQLALSGQAPLDGTKPLALRGNGTIDLALLDPILAANGRHVQGRLQLDAGIAGTLAQPRITGNATVSNGELQDYMQGVHVTDIAVEMQADGQALHIRRFTGRAGSGSLSASGAIDLLAPGMPVQITLDARNARPLASDLINATLSGQLRVSGQATGQMRLTGNIAVARAEITIPDSLPPQVAKLPVRIPGKTPPPPPAASQPLALDLTVDAAQQIFVRGHGLDAEMGGQLRISGTAAAPQIAGGFDLRHGTFSLAGQTLNFTKGRVAFDGYGLQAKLDPTINFVAESTANGVTATLTITGYADQPKIRLSSSPDLPQDEILAQLLFGQSVKQLSPFQVVQIAQALAAISGIGGAGDPLAGVRKGLGLDRLSVGAASGSGPGATVEAGKYVANGVYVGTKQGTSGGTQAQVQIDLTKHLKLETQLGAGGTATGATPDNDPGTSIGLTYQFEY
jgi:translocation and assembly module TamB